MDMTLQEIFSSLFIIE